MKQNFCINPLLKPPERVQKVFFFWDVELALLRSRMTNQKRNLLIIILWCKLSKIEGYHVKEHKILHQGKCKTPLKVILSFHWGPIPLKTHFLLSWKCSENRSSFEMSLLSSYTVEKGFKNYPPPAPIRWGHGKCTLENGRPRSYYQLGLRRPNKMH